MIKTLALAIALALPSPGSAQSWVYALSRSTNNPFVPPGPIVLREVPLTATGPGPVQRERRFDGVLTSGPAVTFDGRYVAWTMVPAGASDGALALFDRRTGQTTVVPGLGGSVLADPAVLRLFLLRATGSSSQVNSITVVEPGSARSIAIDPIGSPSLLSADGRDLFVVRSFVDSGGAWHGQIEVIDPLTGLGRRVVRTLESFTSPDGMALSRDGQRLYVATNSPHRVRVLDALIGAQLASRDITLPFTGGSDSLGSITVDDVHARLFVTVTTIRNSVHPDVRSLILDSLSLADVGGSSGYQRLVDRSQGITLSVGPQFFQYSGCTSAVVETWATGSTPVSRLDVPLDGGCPGLALATPPEAPAVFSFTRSGAAVTFSWSPVVGAGDFQLEAGSSPGLANLAVIRTGSSPPFVVNGVPAGTYYVRLRAINDVGPGAPSVEHVIVVP